MPKILLFSTIHKLHLHDPVKKVGEPKKEGMKIVIYYYERGHLNYYSQPASGGSNHTRFKITHSLYSLCTGYKISCY
jgi:hypothetical protein